MYTDSVVRVLRVNQTLYMDSGCLLRASPMGAGYHPLGNMEVKNPFFAHKLWISEQNGSLVIEAFPQQASYRPDPVLCDLTELFSVQLNGVEEEFRVQLQQTGREELRFLEHLLCYRLEIPREVRFEFTETPPSYSQVGGTWTRKPKLGAYRMRSGQLSYVCAEPGFSPSALIDLLLEVTA